MIRIAVGMLVAAMLVIGLYGCGGKDEAQTTAMEVENPVVDIEKPVIPEDDADSQAEQATGPPSPEPIVEPRTDTKDFTKTSSGLMYKDLKVGEGAAAKSGDRVTVNYKGWLENGKVFDSSLQPGRQPFTFNLGRGEVINGWDEGVAGMKPGGSRELIIPSDLGYGNQGQGTIPPNSTLNFQVDLIKIEN